MTNQEYMIWRFIANIEREPIDVLEEAIHRSNHLHHVRLSSWERSVIARHITARRDGRGVYYSAGTYWCYLQAGLPD